MSGLRALVLAVTALVAGLLGYVASIVASSRGWQAPVMHWISMLALMALAVVVLAAGWRVCKARTRTAKRAVNPIGAVRTLVLAQASAYVGAALGGWHLGVLIDLTRVNGFGSDATWAAALHTFGGAVLVGVGYAVQAMCKLPPEDSAGGEEGGSTRAEGAL